MISRLTLSSLVFSIVAAAALAGAASLPTAHADSIARQVELQRVVVVAQRLPADA